jgi:hypothetical protein
VYIRSKDNSNSWGHYDSLHIFINCLNPTLASITQTFTTTGGIAGTTLTANGSLNNATNWVWYVGSCGGNLIGTGNSIFTSFNNTENIFVRGEGSCTNIFPCINTSVNPQHNLYIKAFIEGYYTSNSNMSTTLLNEGEPTYLNATDTVVVFLIHPTNFGVVNNQKALLYRDGSIKCNFAGQTGTYLLAIQHRNTIKTWSSGTITFAPNQVAMYDFTHAASQAFGSNQVEVDNGIFAIYSGDLDHDGIIDNNDFSIWESNANDFITGYEATDINGDGISDNTDFSVWEGNANNFVSMQQP